MLIPQCRAVELDEFSKSYACGWFGAPRVAVEKFSLQLPPGRILGLLGPNGSGKSTILKALAGLVRPSTGACRIHGEAAGGAAARRRIGYLPESVRLPPRLSAREWLEHGARLSSLSRDETRARVEAMLAQAGLAREADRPLGGFSKGMRQRVAIAQCLLPAPDVLLLDEPASGLDPEARRELLRRLRDFRDEGKTVALSGHLLDSLEGLCDRVVLLARGRVLADGTTTELLGAGAAERTSPLEALYWERIRGVA